MDENLNILAPFKDSFKVKYKKELHKNLPDFHSGVLMLLIGQPGAGKTTIILNILGRFLKYYFEEVHFIGAAFKYDQTLMPLISYYGNCHESCSDTVFNNIIQSRTDQLEDENRGNCCIVLDDLMAMPDFNSRSSSAMARLASVYRHILGGANPTKDNPNVKKSGGLFLVSNQRLFSSIPRNLRACANVILIGKLANAEEYDQVIKEYSLSFGGKSALKEMIQINNSNKYNFLCLYLNGVPNPEIEGPCCFLNFEELLYPTKKFPKKEFNINKIDE